MKTIELSSVLTFAGCFVFLVGILFIIGYVLVKWGKIQKAQEKVQEDEYNDLYKYIEERIDVFTVNRMNYNIIMNQIVRLVNLKYQNRERSEVLTITFLRKFKSECKKQVEENC